MENRTSQSAEDGVVGAGELPKRSCPATRQSRLPDGSKQSAEDGVIEEYKVIEWIIRHRQDS
ncbi:MAG: hypothetical protein ACK53Y_03325, partial [bacterium]